MKKYKWYDIQDEKDFHEGTLQDAKAWLTDFWQWTDIYEDEELHDVRVFNEFMQDIQKATKTDLFEMLSGIDWTIEEIEKVNIITLALNKAIQGVRKLRHILSSKGELKNG